MKSPISKEELKHCLGMTTYLSFPSSLTITPTLLLYLEYFSIRTLNGIGQKNRKQQSSN